MTEKQEEVLKQVHTLLTEHFDCWVVVAENHDIDDEGHTSTRAMWYGGITQILGLLMHEMIRIGKKVVEPDSLIFLFAFFLLGCSTPDKRLYKHYRFDLYEPYAKKMQVVPVRRALPADSKAMRAATAKHIPLTKAKKEIREELPIIMATAVSGVTLAWDANPEPDIAGYRIYHNAPQDVELQIVDTGNVTQFTLDVSKPHVFRVTAYNTVGLESTFSHAVTWGDALPIISLTKDPLYGNMVITLTGQAGYSYDVYKSDDLITWFLMGNVTNVTGTVSIADPTSPSVPKRFYRAVAIY